MNLTLILFGCAILVGMVITLVAALEKRERRRLRAIEDRELRAIIMARHERMAREGGPRRDASGRFVKTTPRHVQPASEHPAFDPTIVIATAAMAASDTSSGSCDSSGGSSSSGCD